MKLELGKIFIKDIRFDDKTHVKDGVLYVNKEEVEKLVLEDDKLTGCHVDIAKPGESVRITPVKDVIEPRVKVSGGEIFPGVIGKVSPQVGTGRTHALEGCCVVTVGKIVGFQEGVIDMSGPAADYCPFSQTYNLCVVVEPADGLETHVYEKAARMAGLKVATYVGEAARELEPDEIVTYETKPIFEQAAMYPDLPKVGYIHMLQSQGLLHDTYFYGRDSKQMVPTMITPLEVMDGALVSGNCVSPGSKTTTWHHLNNAVIEECMKKHGKEINFMGIVLNPLMVSLKEKYRDCMLTIRMAEMLGADGVIISQEGFGNPTTDLMLVCQGLEKRGIKTVIITNEDAGVDGMSESLPDSVTEADAIVSTGNSNATIMLPKMDKTIGVLSDVAKTTGGNVDSIQDDGRLLIEIHGIMGGHNLQGNTYLGAITI